MKVKELYLKEGETQRLYCNKCSKPMRLTFDTFDEDLEEIRIVVENLPMLYCDACQLPHLPDRSRLALIKLHYDAWESGSKQVHTRRRKTEEPFRLTDVKFDYDSDDYHYIPELERTGGDGYLTPVFFNKEVLIRFENHSSYTVSFASKTYGQIYKGLEYSIPFGVNQNDKLIMWLGDIADLATKDQHALMAENIESDHCVGSEFYDAQIGCKFTDSTPEDRLIKARSTFHRRASARFGKPLSRLSKESLQLIENLNPPISFSGREMKDVVDILNKFNIEALHSTNLGDLARDRGKDCKKLGSLKRLEKVLGQELPGKSTSEILAPLFYLYELRVTYSHIHSEEEHEERITAIKKSLGCPEDATMKELYESLIERLIEAYVRLSEMM